MGYLSPTFANAPMDLEGKKPAPSTPIYSGEAHGSRTPSPGAALSLPNTSSSVALSEALSENHELHRHHAVVLPELSLNFSSPLAGPRRRRRPRAVLVLNAEAPLFGAYIGINRDLNRYEYDSFIRVLVTLPHRDIQGYEDALPFLSLLVSP